MNYTISVPPKTSEESKLNDILQAIDNQKMTAIGKIIEENIHKSNPDIWIYSLASDEIDRMDSLKRLIKMFYHSKNPDDPRFMTCPTCGKLIEAFETSTINLASNFEKTQYEYQCSCGYKILKSH